MNIRAVLLLGVAAALSGCESSNDHIPKREHGQITFVLSGTIVSMRPVRIEAGQSSRYGNVLGQTLAATAYRGVISGTLGAYTGDAVERYLRIQDGYEFVVSIENDASSPQSRSVRQRHGGVVSVIQNNSERLSVGDEVYLLVGSGQTRIAKR